MLKSCISYLDDETELGEDGGGASKSVERESGGKGARGESGRARRGSAAFIGRGRERSGRQEKGRRWWRLAIMAVMAAAVSGRRGGASGE
jgi:hypothetical protein